MFSLLVCRITDFQALPDLHINIDDIKYTVNPEFYVADCKQRESTDNDDGWYCHSCLESMTMMHETILGDTFFTRFYTFFNLEDHQIGIAQNKEQISWDQIKSTKDFTDEDKDDFQNLFPELNDDKEESEWSTDNSFSWGDFDPLDSFSYPEDTEPSEDHYLGGYIEGGTLGESEDGKIEGGTLDVDGGSDNNGGIEGGTLDERSAGAFFRGRDHYLGGYIEGGTLGESEDGKIEGGTLDVDGGSDNNGGIEGGTLDERSAGAFFRGRQLLSLNSGQANQTADENEYVLILMKYRLMLYQSPWMMGKPNQSPSVQSL